MASRSPVSKGAAEWPVAEKSAAKKAPPRKATAKKATAKKSPAKKALAKKATDKRAAAEDASAEQQPAARKPTKAAARSMPLLVRPGEKPWSAAEVKAQRAELAELLRGLDAELAGLQEGINDVLRDSGDGAGDDQADTGSKAFEIEQEMALHSAAVENRAQTEQALARLDDGTYGTCASCGKAIGKARLQAIPRATLCVECKQRQERH